MAQRSARTPMTVPYGADQTIYLVVDRFGRQGRVTRETEVERTNVRETEVERTNVETIIADLLSGQFNDPVRVVAFNTLEHWTKNISGDIAAEILTRCDIEGTDVPEHIRDFVATFTERARSTAS
jgi:hypothetical protein